jgi:hypothetical protein
MVFPQVLIGLTLSSRREQTLRHGSTILTQGFQPNLFFSSIHKKTLAGINQKNPQSDEKLKTLISFLFSPLSRVFRHVLKLFSIDLSRAQVSQVCERVGFEPRSAREETP